jgi:ATP-dependent Clp protease, protease subunit
MSDTPPEAVYATFVGEINQQSARALTASLCLATQRSAGSIHLLVQSTGGTMSEGVYLHNFFKSFAIPTTVYCIGAVQSAAVLAFLGARIRKASRFGTFMIHRPQGASHGADLAAIAAASVSLTIDDGRMNTILKEHLTLSAEKWDMFERSYLWLGANEALASGLITEIGDFSPPMGAPIYALGG